MANRIMLNQTSYHGAGAISELPTEVKSRGLKKALICCGPTLLRHGVIAHVTDVLDAAGLSYEIYSDIKPNPTIENVTDGVAAFKAAGADYLIAIGGGSAIDTAKIMWLMYEHPEENFLDLATVFIDIRKRVYKFPKMGIKSKLVCIPTTAGTGSETTLAAVVTDTKTHEKYALNDPVLRPKYAVLDPELTVGLPPHITSTTGMDALTHAVEAYIGHSNTKDTSEKAEVATKLIFENLEEAYKNGKDLHAREQMLLASHYAGIAFTRAYVGNVHAIAHNLGGFYGVPHGLANAIILPYVLDFYGETAYERLARLCECAGVAKAGQTDEQKALDFIQAIRDMNARMNIPDKIEKIQEKDIETIAKRACKEANPLYPVPRIMDLDDCIAIIHRLMP